MFPKLANLRRVVLPIATASLVLWSFSISDARVPIGSDPPKPSSVTTVGSMRVQTFGSGSPAIILIPGLACGSWVWNSTIRTYEKTHALYVVTLPGFDGTAPPPGGASIDKADAALFKLVIDHHLDRPILIGHSLGGFLALRFGTEHAQLVRAIVAIDGTPVIPALSRSTAEQRLAAANRIGDQLNGLTHAQFATGENAVIAKMVTDPTKAAQVGALAATSNPAATGAYAHDLYAADLRPQLPGLTVPTLEIVPVPTAPAALEGPQAATQTKPDRAAGYRSVYAALFAGAPDVRIVPIADSLHFVMIDQPQALFDAISAFIATLPAA